MEEIYLLYSCNEYKEQSSMKLVVATTDEDLFDNNIRFELRDVHMNYKG